MEEKGTSFDEFSTLFGQIGGDVVFIVNELLETDEGQEARAQREVRGQTQPEDGHRKVNVETVRDDGKDVHVTHNLPTENIISFKFHSNHRKASW